VRDVENGEVLVFDDDGMHSHKPFPPMAPRPCIFEYIYFSRPDSMIGGRSVYEVRKTMGARLARESPAQADVVVPVPTPACRPPSATRRPPAFPYELGIIRNHYVGRTFIEPTQHIRQLGVAPQAHRPTARWSPASASCWSTIRSCAAPPRPRSCR
jgi:amidophosphoribosyltransferase